jgi:hypothetical protein
MSAKVPDMSASVMRGSGGRYGRLWGSDTLSLGSDTPSLGSDTPALRSDIPGLGSDTLSLGSDTPSLGSDIPALGADTPALGSDTPSLGSDIPALGSDTLSLGSDIPALGSDTLIEALMGGPLGPPSANGGRYGGCGTFGPLPPVVGVGRNRVAHVGGGRPLLYYIEDWLKEREDGYWV